LAEFARFTCAVLLAFAGMILVKSQRRPVLPWLARTLAAAALFVAALWIVYVALPYPTEPGMPALTIVGSAVLIAGLAAEEFVGADIRRILRM
jgi:peptidoglycan/LPS O-acetylase OafA/YrhL